MEAGAGGDQLTPLLQSSLPSASSQPLAASLKKTGNAWSAFTHIITGIIGSGVLSLAWCMAQLGWIGGPIAMLFFASVTLISALLLCNCYRSPDPEHGPARNCSYSDAVQTIMGKKSSWLCGILIRISMFQGRIVYTVTSGISMRAIQRSNCFQKGHMTDSKYGSTYYMLAFGAIQIVTSQIPDFQNMEWLSNVATIMSFTYTSIGSALSLAKVIGNGYIKGDIGGVRTSTAAQKTVLVSQALGNIAFSYPFSIILIEIQDTLKSPPPETVTMKKASILATCVTTIFYLCCGGFGYAAFGDSAPGNLLTDFGYFKPYWIIVFANACIILHMVGAYQVYSQPVFATVERWFSDKFPSSRFVNAVYNLKLPFLPYLRLNPFRLCFRTVYVTLVTSIAIVFPYFNQVLGVAGAMSFWPLVVYFPVEMYFLQLGVENWTRKWIFLHIYNIVCFIITMFALVGSIEGLLAAKFS